MGDAVRPVGQAEEAGHGGMVGADHGGVGAVDELAVAGDVVVVAVGVQHQQLVAVAGMGGQPAVEQAVHGGPQREELRLGVAPVSISSARSLPNSRSRNGAS
jgi:hypothetical protein